MIIDFTSMPDGTQVPGLYASILYLEATSGRRWLGGSVSSAGLAVVPLDPPVVDPRFQAHLIGVFLRPVTDVTLAAKCYRHAICSYQGIDKSGAGFNTQGVVIPGIMEGNPPSTDWATIPLSIPTGGRLVTFQISNSDESAQNAAFWVKSISFSPQPLPPGGVQIVGVAPGGA